MTSTRIYKGTNRRDTFVSDGNPSLFIGLNGDDTYFVNFYPIDDSSILVPLIYNADRIIEAPNQGIDSIFLDLTFENDLFFIPQNVENLFCGEPSPVLDPDIFFGARIIGNQSNNLIIGTSLNDSLNGDNLISRLTGGNDTLIGGAGDDWLAGGAGDDSLQGGLDNDMLRGGIGNDILEGGSGDDWILDGGYGLDRLIGGSGRDYFWLGFYGAPPNTRNDMDTIVDFESGMDAIELNKQAFQALTLTGRGFVTEYRLSHDEFWSNTTGIAHDATDRIIYNTTNGKLYYDPDGTGNSPAVQIALIENKALLSASDFSIQGYVYDADINGTSGNDTFTISPDDEYNQYIGGQGNDTYIFNPSEYPYFSSGDNIIELENGGIDTVITNGSFQLNPFYGSSYQSITQSFIENLIYVGPVTEQQIYLEGNQINNLISGGSGNDAISGREGNDKLYGNDGNDTLVGDAGNDVLYGGNGHDILVGNDGNDKLYGGDGNDTFLAGTIEGRDGNDLYDGGLGADLIQYIHTSSGVRVDLTQTTNNAFAILSNGLRDKSDAAQIGVDSISNVENIYGSFYFNDFLIGNSQSNEINGLGGDDILQGREGNDLLTGGDGADIFLLNTALNASNNIDTITDFSHNDDTIQLSKSVMSKLGTQGTLSANDFKLSSQTLDSSDRIIYNQDSGALFYDADGSGSSAALQIAIIGNLPTNIDYTDFVIV